jgi:hypothetical protein
MLSENLAGAFKNAQWNDLLTVLVGSERNFWSCRLSLAMQFLASDSRSNRLIRSISVFTRSDPSECSLPICGMDKRRSTHVLIQYFSGNEYGNESLKDEKSVKAMRNSSVRSKTFGRVYIVALRNTLRWMGQSIEWIFPREITVAQPSTEAWTRGVITVELAENMLGKVHV